MAQTCRKINFENAKESIGAMINEFPKDGEYFMVTEEQFDEIVARIIIGSTKAFAEALKKQTKKHSSTLFDARISTYKMDFGFFRFI